MSGASAMQGRAKDLSPLQAEQGGSVNGTNAMQRRWLALASAALGLSALAAIVLVLARTPVLTSAGVAAHFSAALIMHVDLATLVWFLAFSAALFGMLAGHSCRALEWPAFLLAAGGVLAVFASPFVAPGPAQLSNYFPVSDSPWFTLGLVAVFSGASIAVVGHAAATVWARMRRQAADGLAPALCWSALPLLLAAISLGLSLRALPASAVGMAHELVSWGPGHLLESFFVCAMMLAWLWLAASLGWRLPTAKRIALSFALVALPTLAALPVHWLFAVDSSEFRKAFTVLMAVSTWPGPLLLLSGWRGDLFRGETAAPALRDALRGSLLLFVVGCLLGTMIRADNTMVPAHYHGTVGAVTLAFIGVATRVLDLDMRGRWARARIGAYGLGFTLMVAGLAWTGLLNAPRKSPYMEPAAEVAAYPFAMALHGIGGLLAVSATVLFAWSALSALRRRRDGFVVPIVSSSGEPAVARRRDVRRRALGIALAAALAIGGAISLPTQRIALRSTFDDWLAKVPAIDKVSHVAEQRRREVTQRFAQGVAMLQARQFDFAITAFHRVLQLSPEAPEAHVNLGFALIGLKEYAAAKDFFESALALRADQLNAYYGLAVAYEGMGDLEPALGAMRTYAHLAGKDDFYRIKAEAAIWEWGERVAMDRAAKSAAAIREKPEAQAGGRKN